MDPNMVRLAQAVEYLHALLSELVPDIADLDPKITLLAGAQLPRGSK